MVQLKSFLLVLYTGSKEKIILVHFSFLATTEYEHFCVNKGPSLNVMTGFALCV